MANKALRGGFAFVNNETVLFGLQYESYTPHNKHHKSHVTCTPYPHLFPFIQDPVYLSKLTLMNT
jgi:hypothetical protein